MTCMIFQIESSNHDSRKADARPADRKLFQIISPILIRLESSHKLIYDGDLRAAPSPALCGPQDGRRANICQPILDPSGKRTLMRIHTHYGN